MAQHRRRQPAGDVGAGADLGGEGFEFISQLEQRVPPAWLKLGQARDRQALGFNAQRLGNQQDDRPPLGFQRRRAQARGLLLVSGLVQRLQVERLHRRLLRLDVGEEPAVLGHERLQHVLELGQKAVHGFWILGSGEEVEGTGCSGILVETARFVSEVQTRILLAF